MSPPRILIVEDERIIARDLQAQLLALGYAVVGIANTGEQAVQLASALHPDLVLMDIKLGPGIDGVAAAQAIRQQAPIPVVFLSAYAADDILERAQLAEPYGYMLKPFSERELGTVLQMAFYKQRAEHRERDLREHSQAILDHMTEGVLTFNQQGLVTTANPSAATMFGYAPSALLGLHMDQLLPALKPKSGTPGISLADNAAWRALVKLSQSELEGRCQDGSCFPLGLTVSVMPAQGELNYICIFSDLRANYLVTEQLHSQAFTDELTGLSNRRCLLDRLDSAVLVAAHSQQVGALLFLDLDHFRQANETLGPGCGDDLLRDAAKRLLGCVREDDTVAHFGGDEFMVMLDALGADESTAANRAEAVAKKILLALSQPYSLKGHPYKSSASVGLVLFDGQAQEVDELLKTADAAMYQAKAAGRNTVRFYDPAMQAQVLARTALEKDLERGLHAKEFVLHYQLQVDAQGVPLGAEALVRWQHPKRGLVPPGQFIALAETTRLILPLGQWVLQEACRQLALWARQPGTRNLTMAVNVSALQFAQTDFVKHVAAAIDSSGIRPRLLELELTESMLVGDVADVLDKMQRIRALGVRFSLDDFGTGYSSLMYLKRLHVDQLKIDQSFVRDVLNNADDQVIAQTILSLGHNFSMQVIAEGVETEEQYQMLCSMGCDAFQGYLFARPVAPEEFMHFYNKIGYSPYVVCI
jgi:diguanylate cyclase (GGDEF)-like protein/PAS domain S-box-containing protein